MALIAPGVSVTITNQSFYIPASSPTIPALFVATRANKYQPDGVTYASGTQESGIVRTITSIGQSLQMYGVPYFWTDNSGNPFNGDARNEYGLFALNQYLSVGNLAYVVRANIDLTDAASSFIGAGVPQLVGSATRTGVGNGTIASITASSAFVKLDTFDVVMTSATTFNVQGTTAYGIIGTGVVGTPFTSNVINFTVTAGSTPFAGDDYFQFSIGYVPTSYTGTGNGTMSALLPLASAVVETVTVTMSSATAYTVSGSVSGPLGAGVVGATFTDVGNHITFVINSGTVPFISGDLFTITLSQVNLFNPLGANDAAKRVTITTALAAQILSNQDILSPVYQFNLLVCPGYWEVAQDLITLSTEVADEAFTIADTPSTLNVEQTVAWGATSARVTNTNIAYYYPWGQGTNLDGTTVVCAPSGIALQTYAYSDSISYVWFAPAGQTRGLVTGIGAVGYVSGAPGTAAAFSQLNLNTGQQGSLYQDFSNINPIVNFPQQGILVWGQKTSANADSALDRVNVVRTMMYIKRALRIGAMPFVFEINDSVTQSNLKSMADSFLNQVMAQRGLTDFVTLCNESNNPPEVVNSNELFMDVACVPSFSAEFLVIPITVLAAGATLPS